MVRKQLVRSRPEMARKHPDSHESKRGFKPEPVLTEPIQGSNNTGPKENRTFSFIAKTAKKAWRFAVLAAPVLPACSITDNDKLNAGTVSIATIGLMAAGFGMIWAAVEGVRALVSYIKNKKENKTESA